jgi:hypothetical protein
MTQVTLFLALVAGHALGDFPLQGDFLARAKNHRAPIAGVDWWIALAAHAAIQGAIVGALTGSLVLACFEFVAHAIIDRCKCEGLIGFRSDQLLHLWCKAVCVYVLS